MRRIVVAGMRASGDGYPNAGRTIAILGDQSVGDVVDLGDRLPSGLHLWRLRSLPVMSRVVQGVRLVAGNAKSLGRLLAVARRVDIAYVGYPAMFLLALARFVPAFIRPRLVADAYISVWDSAINDRGGVNTSGGRVLRRLEAFALRAAWRVLVDTEANRNFLVDQLGLDPARVVSMPLAIDAVPFLNARPQRGDDDTVTILFSGSFIPLHGIEVILEAARQMRDRTDIKFVLQGDGQLSAALEGAILEGCAHNMEWQRSWLPLPAVADLVGNAHICLGVFGGEGKAARVLPYKVYQALAAGRTVVTQAGYSLPFGVPPPPVISVPTPSASDPETPASVLAAILRRLADDHLCRKVHGQEAAVYFDRWLSEAAIASAWQKLLADA